MKDDWAERSAVVGQEGRLTFHHFDLYAQALAKIERGHVQDLEDVGEMLGRGLVDRRRLAEYFAAIEPQLYRYPAIDPPTFSAAVARVAAGVSGSVTPLEPMAAKAVYFFRMTGWPIMSARKRLTRKRGKCPRLEYARA